MSGHTSYEQKQLHSIYNIKKLPKKQQNNTSERLYLENIHNKRRNRDVTRSTQKYHTYKKRDTSTVPHVIHTNKSTLTTPNLLTNRLCSESSSSSAGRKCVRRQTSKDDIGIGRRSKDVDETARLTLPPVQHYLQENDSMEPKESPKGIEEGPFSWSAVGRPLSCHPVSSGKTAAKLRETYHELETSEIQRKEVCLKDIEWIDTSCTEHGDAQSDGLSKCESGSHGPACCEDESIDHHLRVHGCRSSTDSSEYATVGRTHSRLLEARQEAMQHRLLRREYSRDDTSVHYSSMARCDANSPALSSTEDIQATLNCDRSMLKPCTGESSGKNYEIDCKLSRKGPCADQIIGSSSTASKNNDVYHSFVGKRDSMLSRSASFNYNTESKNCGEEHITPSPTTSNQLDSTKSTPFYCSTSSTFSSHHVLSEDRVFHRGYIAAHLEIFYSPKCDCFEVICYDVERQEELPRLYVSVSVVHTINEQGLVSLPMDLRMIRKERLESGKLKKAAEYVFQHLGSEVDKRINSRYLVFRRYSCVTGTSVRLDISRPQDMEPAHIDPATLKRLQFRSGMALPMCEEIEDALTAAKSFTNSASASVRESDIVIDKFSRARWRWIWAVNRIVTSSRMAGMKAGIMRGFVVNKVSAQRGRLSVVAMDLDAIKSLVSRNSRPRSIEPLKKRHEFRRYACENNVFLVPNSTYIRAKEFICNMKTDTSWTGRSSENRGVTEGVPARTRFDC